MLAAIQQGTALLAHKLALVFDPNLIYVRPVISEQVRGELVASSGF
jgi:hypothetical protein